MAWAALAGLLRGAGAAAGKNAATAAASRGATSAVSGSGSTLATKTKGFLKEVGSRALTGAKNKVIQGLKATPGFLMRATGADKVPALRALYKGAAGAFGGTGDLSGSKSKAHTPVSTSSKGASGSSRGDFGSDLEEKNQTSLLKRISSDISIIKTDIKSGALASPEKSQSDINEGIESENDNKRDQILQESMESNTRQSVSTLQKMANDVTEIKDRVMGGLGSGAGGDGEGKKQGGLISALISAASGFLTIGIPGMISKLTGFFKGGISGMFSRLSGAMSGLLSKVSGMMAGIGKSVSNMVSSAWGKLSSVKDGAVNLAQRAMNGIRNVGGRVVEGARNLAGRAAAGISRVGSAVLQKGKGLLTAGSAMAGSLWNKGKGLLSAGAGLVSKLGWKGAAKAAAIGAKKVPILGAAVGLGLGAHRAWGGDWKGAAIEVGSGLASTIPVAGTAASVALDGWNMKRDYDAEKAREGGVGVPPTPIIAPSQPTPTTAEPNSSVQPAKVQPTTTEPNSSVQPAKVQPTTTESTLTSARGEFERSEQRGVLGQILSFLDSVKKNLFFFVDSATDENKGIYTKPAKELDSDFGKLFEQANQTEASNKTPKAQPSNTTPKPQEVSGELTPTTPHIQKWVVPEPQTTFNAEPISSVLSDVKGSLFEQTQDAIDRGVRYGFGSKDSSTGAIDCSGWVAEINKSFITSLNDAGENISGSADAKKLFNAPAAGIVENIAGVTGEILSNDKLTAETVREGMIIGEDNGDKGWDRGRFQGIDHVTQVVKDPKTGRLMVSQSSSGRGVSLMPVEDYLSKKNARGTKLFGVDTNSAIDRITGGEFSASMLAAESSHQGGVLSDAAKKEEARRSAPVIVQAPSAPSVPNQRSASPRLAANGSSSPNIPLTSRDPSSPVRDYSRALINASV